MQYTEYYSKRQTPQNQPIPGSGQTKNAAGGYTYNVSAFQRLERFLILGSDQGSYYASARKLTIENANCVEGCLGLDPIWTINKIVEISESGRAPKNDPAIFALAIAAGYKDKEVRKYALSNISRVCRIGTHILTFVDAVQHFRGWGRLLREAVGSWYLDKSPSKLAYQVTKYQNRSGMNHRVLLKKSHPYSVNEDTNLVLKYAAGNAQSHDFNSNAPVARYLAAVEEAKKTNSENNIIRLIKEYGLVREHIPYRWLNSPKVWECLLDKMPMTALIRNLAKMTNIGLLVPNGIETRKVIDKIVNKDLIKKSRVHPVQLLIALQTYKAGHGLRGSLYWTPVNTICDALEDAFYMAFDNVEPTNKRFLLGIDVSGSMGMPLDNSYLTAAEGAAAMAMVTARTEKQYQMMGFAGQFRDLGISARDNLGNVLGKTRDMNFGRTDCALPMVYALDNNIPVDVFIVYTDSETWYGNIHPVQALHRYRDKMGIDAKLIVTAMVASRRTIADPSDPGMLDVVGFDASVPSVIRDFIIN